MRERLVRLRRWRPTPTAVRRSFLGALVANTAIVVTGGAVRLTASGLGCPNVPKCTDTSLVPTSEMGAHGVIEFGNRMLTFALAAAVAVALVTAWRAGRRDLVRSAAVLVVGIVAQAGLGAVTVITGLNPVTVMAHFLLSMVLIAVAVRAYEISSAAPDREVHAVRRELRLGAGALLAVVALTLFAGTVVTGTGPHSGDKDATDRLPFDLATVTQVHADLVFLLVGLSVGLLLAVAAVAGRGFLVRRAVVLLGVVLAQGTIGYAQYASDLPVVLVGLHILGASLVWIAALRVALGMNPRLAQPPPVPLPESSMVSRTGRPPEQETLNSTSPESERNLARASRPGPGR
jgi:cytochrome c oxidase assembly protein subunit 15